MKESFYFSHDYNARNDDKILELRDRYKNEGYAVYFYCLETMAERGDGYIMPTLIGGLSLGYGVSKEWLIEFLEYCVSINLLNKDENGYFSQRMIDHINMREMFRQEGIKGAKLRWKNSPPNAKERKGKESKVNNKEIQCSEQSSQVQEIMNIFYKINPTLNFGNTTYRKSCLSLIKRFGFDGVKRMATSACQIQGQQYAPTSTNPYIFEQKIADFKIYFDKEKNKANKFKTIEL